MPDQKFDPEKLRPIEYFAEPDPRSGIFSTFDRALKVSRPIELADHHASISEIRLIPSVPTNIATQFEVARNLFLYSWLVYRFFNVAEHHALACLELSLKCRYENELVQIAEPQKFASLSKLLKHSIKQGHIKNEGFSVWHQNVARRSVNREEQRRIQRMVEMGNSNLIFDDSVNEVTDEDRDFDFLAKLLESLPAKRNNYAHGSDMLDFKAINTIRIVSEIINQLFAPPEAGK